MWLRPIVKSCVGSVALVLAAAAVLAGARLLPWWFDPRVPGAAAWVFGRGLLSVALAVAVALGVPVGMALAAARLSERGERLALLSTGRSPWALSVRAAVVPLVLVAGFTAASTSLGQRARTATTAHDLIAAARDACTVDAPLASIPGTEAAFVLRDGVPVFAVGIPGVVLFARDVVVEPGAGILRDVELFLRGPPAIRLHVGEARARGLDLPGHPAGVPAAPTLIGSAFLTLVASVALFFGLLRRGEDRLPIAIGLAVALAVPGLAALGLG